MFYTDLEIHALALHSEHLRRAERWRLARLARSAPPTQGPKAVRSALAPDEQADGAQAGRHGGAQARPETARALDLKPRQTAW